MVSDTESAVCEATLVPRISVTKQCETLLVLDEATNKLTVTVSFSGEVCAKDDQGDSNVQLTGVSVVETHDGQSQTVLSNATIAPGACQSYSGSFFPTSLEGSSGTSDDTVTASGTGSISAGDVETDAIPASCNLCPLPS
jgi:hypothetical protein